jgi:hypothetical protein
MDFVSRFPTEESSQIKKPHDLVIVNDTIGLGEVIMHKAHILSEKRILPSKGLFPAITENEADIHGCKSTECLLRFYGASVAE